MDWSELNGMKNTKLNNGRDMYDDGTCEEQSEFEMGFAPQLDSVCWLNKLRIDNKQHFDHIYGAIYFRKYLLPLLFPMTTELQRL